MAEPDLTIDFLDGQAPVFGRGTVNGYRFIFHARWDGWGFAVALTPDQDPEAIIGPDERSFYLEGDYGEPGGYAASSMPNDDARAIILACAKQFANQHPTRASD
jgi:hypothetical protein